MSSVTNDPNAPGLVEQATSELGEAASVAGEKVGELKQQGRGKLGEVLGERTSKAGRQSRQAAQALRRTVSEMESNGDAQGAELSPLVDGIADRLEHLGSYLESTRGDELLRDVEDAARRRPWMVAGLGLLVGLAASRLLKASAERRYGDRWALHDGGYQGGHGTATGPGHLSRAR
jgi:ElaB/YqjD/DUF883 family membrane-anchored ribosome-binding protein